MPVESAPAGAEAYSPEEQAAREEAERKAKLKRIQELGGRG